METLGLGSIRLGCTVLVAVALMGFGQVGGAKELRPQGKEYDAVAGREIYANACLRCHGIDGKGALGIPLVPKPADLTSQAVQNRLDASLFKRIHDGKPNTAMGAWRTTLSDDEIWDVLAYVRTLKQQ
jgi:mono/diheme cytochrome c family protein